MARDIGQRLLDDAEDDKLAVLCQPANVLTDLQVDPWMPLRSSKPSGK